MLETLSTFAMRLPIFDFVHQHNSLYNHKVSVDIDQLF